MDHLFESNRRWSEQIRNREPDFFRNLESVQNPRYFWIGCSDSRVPANEILGLRAGEVFVHRNVGNLVIHTDFNCLVALQYAVDVLKVEHVMVVGHYGCGGVKAAMDGNALGLIDNWLRHIRSIHRRHACKFEGLDIMAREDLLCELNVLDQARHVEETTILQNAWQRGQNVEVHAWIYRLSDGLLHDLNFASSKPPNL